MEMICRNVVREDLDFISKLNEQQDFRLKDIDSCVIDKVVEDSEGNKVAYGIVKYFAEAIILLDLNSNKITRLKALRKLMEYAIWGSQKRGLKQLHVFVLDPKVAEILRKHYGFKDLDGIPLVKDL